MNQRTSVCTADLRTAIITLSTNAFEVIISFSMNFHSNFDILPGMDSSNQPKLEFVADGGNNAN